MHLRATIPCLIASIASDRVCVAWGIEHSQHLIASDYAEQLRLQWNAIHPGTLLCVILAGAAGGLASKAFAILTHQISRLFRHAISSPILRPMAGGCVIIVLVGAIGHRDYLGLGDSSPDPDMVTISSSFEPGGAHPLSWAWKTLFTAVTLGSGFKGGEVTPLFYIGSTLGNTLGTTLNMPVDLFAAIGLVAVFAGATNTPFASTIMAVELFGSEHVVYFLLACQSAFLASGRTSIFPSQRLPKRKPRERLPDEKESAATSEEHGG